MSERWWVLADSDLRDALQSVEEGQRTAAEAYALLMEHSGEQQDG